MDLIALSRAISELGIYIVIAGAFFIVVFWMRNQNDKLMSRNEQLNDKLDKNNRFYITKMDENQDKYLESMDKITTHIGRFDEKMDKMDEKIDNLTIEVRELKKDECA